jgi:Domain of unknown function (DUF4160)
MPVVFRIRGFRFFFYSNEGSPREQPHIHVEAGGRGEVLASSQVRLAYNDGFDGKTLRGLLRLVEVNSGRIERAWRDFFG